MPGLQGLRGKKITYSKRKESQENDRRKEKKKQERVVSKARAATP